MTTTVTYIGEDGALVHGRPGGTQYTFFRKQPLEITDKEDIEFYRMKEKRGSPFRVEPKLVEEVVEETPFPDIKPVETPEAKTPRKGKTGKKVADAPSRKHSVRR